MSFYLFQNVHISQLKVEIIDLRKYLQNLGVCMIELTEQKNKIEQNITASKIEQNTLQNRIQNRA